MTTERHIIAMGGLLAAVMLLAGCNITIPKLPDGGTLPTVLTNALPPVVTEQPAQTNADPWAGQPVKTISKYVAGIENAPITANLKTAAIKGDKISFNYDPVDWPTKGDKNVDKQVCLVWLDGGTWIIGDFDGGRREQTVKGLENVHGGYIQSRKPSSGQECYFLFVSWAGNGRSNCVPCGRWP